LCRFFGTSNFTISSLDPGSPFIQVYEMISHSIMGIDLIMISTRKGRAKRKQKQDGNYSFSLCLRALVDGTLQGNLDTIA
jgi:hypothetical protein